MRYILLIILLFQFSCNFSGKPIDPDPEFVHIGTFNIAWLGDGVKDRVRRRVEDYARIAELIRDSDAEILALQEIENEGALNGLKRYLPGWNFAIADTDGPQNLAFLYKDYIELDTVFTYQAVKVNKRTRPALIAKAKMGNFDFYLMNVHFKSTSRYDDTEEKRQASFKMRRFQSKAVVNWIDSILSNDIEKDLIILGDFNDNPDRGEKSNISLIVDNNEMNFLTRGLRSCKNPNWDMIDHIIVTNSSYDRYFRNSRRVVSQYSMFNDDEAKRISDHCPVIATFDVRPEDND